MTGLERLKEIAKSTNDFVISRCIALEMEIAGICDQIEREHLREVDDISGRDADILAWVEEHGGLAEVREYYECGRRIEPWNEQKADLYELMNECGGVEEIKKRLMPAGMEWPRFDDWEPVRPGDEFADGLGGTRVCTSVEFLACEEGVRDVLIHWDGDDPDNAMLVCMASGERVKRPAPKVLDADGVEIRVGDTVCGTRDMEPMKVVDTDSHECGFKRIKCEKEGDGFWFYCPDELTHKLPVIAADGKPLREGETVWGVDSGTRYTVEKITDELIPIKCRSEMGSTASLCPSQLTHERPESWGRLEDDATMPAAIYCERMGIEVEEGCSFVEPMARDLVRRAKKLAGVEA